MFVATVVGRTSSGYVCQVHVSHATLGLELLCKRRATPASNLIASSSYSLKPKSRSAHQHNQPHDSDDTKSSCRAGEQNSTPVSR
jgi:hypothetical protein